MTGVGPSCAGGGAGFTSTGDATTAGITGATTVPPAPLETGGVRIAVAANGSARLPDWRRISFLDGVIGIAGGSDLRIAVTPKGSEPPAGAAPSAMGPEPFAPARAVAAGDG